jgi:hypothetical protein
MPAAHSRQKNQGTPSTTLARGPARPLRVDSTGASSKSSALRQTLLTFRKQEWKMQHEDVRIEPRQDLQAQEQRLACLNVHDHTLAEALNAPRHINSDIQDMDDPPAAQQENPLYTDLETSAMLSRLQDLSAEEHNTPCAQ